MATLGGDDADQPGESLAFEQKHDVLASIDPLPYEYMPLKNPNEIRLLTLEEPDENERLVRCRLITTSLDEPGQYMSLSYAWGKCYRDRRHLTHQLMVDGKVLPVTGTLYRAIKRMRKVAHSAQTGIGPWQGMPLLLWADAVCINQNDSDERQAQVLMMGKIFSAAACLTVWLGEPHSRAEVRAYNPNDPIPDFYEDFPHLRYVFALRWFRRRWVIQELASTKTELRFVQLGRHRFRWSNFVVGIEEAPIPPYTHWNIRSEPAYQLIRSIENMPKEDERKPTLLQNLDGYHSAQCGDGRDVVYALMSLSSDGDSISVSYTISAHELYMQLARIYARTNLEALLLSAALRLPPDGHPPISNPERLPSWVPQWGSPILTSYYHTPELERAISARYAPSCDNRFRSFGTYNIDRSLAVEGWLFEDADQSLGLRFSELFLDPGILHESLAGRFRQATWLVLEGCNFAFVVRPANHHAQPHLLEQYRFYELCGFRHFSSHWRGRDDLNFTENGNPSDSLDRGRKEKIFLV